MITKCDNKSVPSADMSSCQVCDSNNIKYNFKCYKCPILTTNINGSCTLSSAFSYNGVSFDFSNMRQGVISPIKVEDRLFFFNLFVFR